MNESVTPPSLETSLLTEATPPTTTEPAATLLTEPATPAVESTYVALAATDIAELAGADFTIPEALQTKAAELFSTLKLTKETAAPLVSLYTDLAREAGEANAAAWSATIDEWQAATKAHPDFGGDKLEASLATAKQFIIDYGDPDFNKMLAVTGTGNHPAMLAFILKAAKAVPGEAKPAPATMQSSAKSLAEQMFPNIGAN
jgi:hypothetical protein